MLHILGMGSAYPESVIDNQFLEDLGTGTNAAWITEKIGILERRTSLPLDYIKETKNSDTTKALKVSNTNCTTLGTDAALVALEQSGVSPDQIGMVMVNCCTPEFAGNSEAASIAKRLGIKNAKTFDVFTACPAFALHLDFLSKFEESELPDHILCLSTATLTQKVDYNDRTDGAIWGDGAAAYVISPKKEGPLQVVETKYKADPSRCQAVVVDTFGYFHQDGRAVRNFSVLQTVKMVRGIESRHDIDWTRDIFIGHQANYTMLQQITNNRKIEDANHWYNVNYIGNQAGAGAPASLAEHWKEITPGQNIVVAVVGAGLSWGSALLKAK